MHLPENATATDVIDLLSEEVMGLVERSNADRELTHAQFAAAHARAFAEALPVFLAKLRAMRPELAACVAEQFVAEEGERMAAEQQTPAS